MTSVTPVRTVLACVLALALAAAGCGDDPTSCNCQNPPPVVVETPQQAMARFEIAYEAEDLDAYADLLATDFSYRFSAFADPVLVSQYGDTWGVARDTSSTAHLFTGFTNEFGEFVPGADSISLALNAISYKPDPAHADSTRHYVLADSALVTLAIVLPDDLEYIVTAIHSFHLVRGDAARLSPAQTPDSTRWYIRRWDDFASPIGVRAPGRYAPAHVMPAEGTSWGSIKAHYLE